VSEPQSIRDTRAAYIGRYLRSGRASNAAIQVIAYLIEQSEREGRIELFVSEEIDNATLH
jgi:hypothetical protein